MSSNSDSHTTPESSDIDSPNEPAAETTTGTSNETSIRQESKQEKQESEDSLLDSSRAAYNGLTRNQQIVVVGGVVTAIGSFLPWASAFGTSVLGINGDGIITLAMAIIGVAVVYFMPLSTRDTNLLVASAAGIIAVLVALVGITGFSSIGVYVTLIGGIVMAYPGIRTAVGNYQRGIAE